jgi:hypothetical protein
MSDSLDTLMDAWSDDLQVLALDAMFPYIYSKAANYLEIGPDLYRESDAFKQPKSQDTIILEDLKKGCMQIMEGKGFSNEAPFEKISVAASYALMEMFHFRFMSRKSSYMVFLADQKGLIDHMTFSHLIQKQLVTWYFFTSKKND